jgi:hypothetical protein
MEEGLRMSIWSGLGFPSPCVLVESICTCPRHKKKKLYEVYVRWTSNLSLVSLIVEINKNID